jgi:predicted HTH domain antitoxin
MNRDRQVNHTALAHKEVEALLRTGLYESREEVIADAIRNLLLNNKPLRLELAIDLFRTDEVSLGRAAEIAGIDRWHFQEVLCERHIPVLIEAEFAAAMDEDLAFFFGKAHPRTKKKSTRKLVPRRGRRIAKQGLA